MQIAIIGGGIAGLALALHLHKRNISCQIYEAAPAFSELGVGITLLPHATRELANLCVLDQIERQGIENFESCFYTRFGQPIFKEMRGRHAGYEYPEIGIHRGKLHGTLWTAVREKLGADCLHFNHRCTGFQQHDSGVTLRFSDQTSNSITCEKQADLVVACDGVNSAIRRQLYPTENLVFSGVNSWRGVTRHHRILTGRSYIRIGSIKTAKFLLYPISDSFDDDGRQLINWVAEITMEGGEKNDWNKPASADAILPYYETWKFPWLNVPELIAGADAIFEYPMVDKDPIARWTFGRITLAGDAAHPMYPRGSNGAAQALIDVRTLADHVSNMHTPFDAFIAYEKARLKPASLVVESNRKSPPDVVNIRVEELTGDRPFDNLDDHISQDELRELLDRYKQLAGFDEASLAK